MSGRNGSNTGPLHRILDVLSGFVYLFVCFYYTYTPILLLTMVMSPSIYDWLSEIE